MEMIGTVILWIIMACAVVGCIASVAKPESEVGRQFVAGVESVGSLWIAVAGIFASIPYLTAFINGAFGPLYNLVGADDAIAATTIVAVDMGGYQLAYALRDSYESWIQSMITGYMAGATIVFTIPVAIKMVPRSYHKYMALGIMSGVLTIPIGVLVACTIIAFTNPTIREACVTSGEATYQLAMNFSTIFINLIPLIIVCVLIAIGLKLIPNGMIKGFMVFGTVLESTLKIIFVIMVVDYFTGLPSTIMGSIWHFDPIVADEKDLVRALEACGYTAMMLCGAFPFVYLLQKFLSKPLGKLGRYIGLSGETMTGLLATCANVLALFAMTKRMNGRDFVICVSFAVCCAFLLGDHLSFAANWQPTLIVPVLLGKFLAGICAIIFAKWLAIRKADELWASDAIAQKEFAECQEVEA
jgi:ethanolamine transporter